MSRIPAATPIHFRVTAGQSARLDVLLRRFGVPLSVLGRRLLELGMEVLEKSPEAFARADHELHEDDARGDAPPAAPATTTREDDVERALDAIESARWPSGGGEEAGK